MSASGWVCAGCGWEVPDGAHPFACAARVPGDDVDHVLTRPLSTTEWTDDGDPNPFVRFRQLMWAYQVACRGGISDDAYVDLVRALDAAVARVDGHGFVTTPYRPSAGLAQRLDAAAVWVKDDTGNVAGSHKARHLMGVALYLEVLRRLGADDGTAPLAIASCGNAALAAAVIARAASRRIRVFIPTDAKPAVVQRLRQLDADIRVCHRQEGIAGDPCYHAFQAAVSQGALPFCVQGPDCGLTIDGGQTIAWEMALEGPVPDVLFVQIGGGAFASACARGFQQARVLGLIDRVPRLHAVQTDGCHPLVRAWDALTALPFERAGATPPAQRAVRAEVFAGRSTGGAAELDYARRNRGSFMWPWESEPRSVAHGILDDETYDWLAVVRAMVDTSGWPVVVDDAALLEATGLAADVAGVNASPTGAAGLAGALVTPLKGLSVAVILSGVSR